MRKGPRQTVFVCVCVADGNLVTETLVAVSVSEATQKFKEKYDLDPEKIHGPFFKKRAQVIEATRTLQFTNQNKKAIYGDWFVNAFMLKDPVDQAYLIFIKRVDDKKVPTPKGTITVPISELRFI